MEYNGGAPAMAYANWAAKMAVGLKTGVPWVMCKQDDAPDPVVKALIHLFFLSCGFLIYDTLIPYLRSITNHNYTCLFHFHAPHFFLFYAILTLVLVSGALFHSHINFSGLYRPIIPTEVVFLDLYGVVFIASVNLTMKLAGNLNFTGYGF